MKNQLEEKSWDEFRGTGLVTFINSILHIFGWAIVFEMKDGKARRCYPARTMYRGFDQESMDRAYERVAIYMKDNSGELYDDTMESLYADEEEN